MTTASAGQTRRPPWEPIVALAAVLSLALLPVHIHRAFGLPAHPLILHVPVVFIPVLGLAAIAAAIRPSLHGPLLAGFSVVTLAATLLTLGAGSAFRHDLRSGADNATLTSHAQSGQTAAFLVGVLTALLVEAMFARRRGRGGRAVLRVLIVLTAVGAVFFVIRTGHLGAKLAWGHVAGGPPAAARP